MPEQAREQTTIDAPIEACWSVLVDFDRYPEWAEDLKAVSVIEADDQDRGLVVEFRAAGMGRSTTYRLRYDYEGAPGRLGWALEEGDVTRAIDGAYLLTATSEGTTELVYELSIDLIMPIPGFVKRRAEDRIIRSALSALKARVESLGT